MDTWVVFTLLWSCDVTDELWWPRWPDWKVLTLAFEDPPSFHHLGHLASRCPDWNLMQIPYEEKKS